MKIMKKYLFINLFLMLSLFAKTQTLSDGLQAYYKFNHTLQDETLNGNDLTILNGNAASNSIYQSDDEIDFITGSAVASKTNFNTNGFNAYGISIWVKTSQIKSHNQTILQGAYLGIGIHIEANTGKIGGFFSGNSSNSYSGTAAITDGKWHHIVFQCNGNEMFVYVDGVLDGNVVSTMLTGDNKIYIGNSNQGNKSFNGAVNELRIYDRMLSECEITELYRHLAATIDASNGNSVAPNDLIVQDKACNQIIYSKVSVYPNPPLGNFTIEFENINEIDFIIIFDINGRPLIQKVIGSDNKVEMNLESLERGLHFITIHRKNGIETIQILKP
jgi:hypothetical protein